MFVITDDGYRTLWSMYSAANLIPTNRVAVQHSRYVRVPMMSAVIVHEHGLNRRRHIQTALFLLGSSPWYPTAAAQANRHRADKKDPKTTVTAAPSSPLASTPNSAASPATALFPPWAPRGRRSTVLPGWRLPGPGPREALKKRKASSGRSQPPQKNRGLIRTLGRAVRRRGRRQWRTWETLLGGAAGVLA